jgi:hypothetical protein
MINFFNSNDVDLRRSMSADCCMPQLLGGGIMVAMEGQQPPWSVSATSLTCLLYCLMATFYSCLCSFWYKNKEQVITPLKRVITCEGRKTVELACPHKGKSVDLSAVDLSIANLQKSQK